MEYEFSDIDFALENAIDELETHDYEALLADISDFDDIRAKVNELFAAKSQGERFAWEELAALTVIGRMLS